MAVPESQDVEQRRLINFAPLFDEIELAPSSPETHESSDPETDDYFASSEDFNDNTNLFNHRSFSNPTIRNDSATLQWTSYRDATPLKPASIHPAFRADPFSFSYELTRGATWPTTTRSLHTSQSVPQLQSPINFPLRSTQDSPPVSPKCVPHTTQLKKKLSTIFRFGEQNASSSEPLSSQQEPISSEQDRRSKLDQIRESLKGLNIAQRLRSLAGTKRTQQETITSTNSTKDITIDNSQFKIRRPDIDSTYPARVHEASARLQAALDICDRHRIHQHRIYSPASFAPYLGSDHAITSTPHITPAQYSDNVRPAVQYAFNRCGRPPPQENKEALEALEGGTVSPATQVPVGLETRTSPFKVEDVAFLRKCIQHAEEEAENEDLLVPKDG